MPKKKASKKPANKPEGEKNPVGRPPTYKTPEELQAKIDEYFKKCPDTQDVWKDGEKVEVPVITISGLVLFLGFCDRASFYDYEKKKEFSHTIKRARTFIELEYEKALRTGHVTGAIFALKNFGWKDRTEIDSNVNFNKMPSVKIDGKTAEFNIGE